MFFRMLAYPRDARSNQPARKVRQTRRRSSAWWRGRHACDARLPIEWIIESYDRRTDRDGQNRFTLESAFISAAEELLCNIWKGSCPQHFPMAGSSMRRR